MLTNQLQNSTKGMFIYHMESSLRIKKRNHNYSKLKNSTKIFKRIKYGCMLWKMTGTNGKFKQIFDLNSGQLLQNKTIGMVVEDLKHSEITSLCSLPVLGKYGQCVQDS